MMAEGYRGAVDTCRSDEDAMRGRALARGERDRTASGRLPEGSVNAAIESRLVQLADAWQAFNVPTPPDDGA